MSKNISEFNAIQTRSGTTINQIQTRSGTILWCASYTLSLSSKPTGVDTITCYRYSSNQPGASTGSSAVLTNGSTVYYGDVIYISATASSGYKAPSTSSSTGTISNNNLTVDGNESITVTAGELDVAPVYITAGTGVSSVFLSTNINATSGSASGSNFNIGDTVYGFAVLQTGYNPPSGWIPVSGAIFRVDSMTVAVSGNDFGTQSGSLKSFTITLSGTYCSWKESSTTITSKTAYYGDVISKSGTSVTCKIGSSSTNRWIVTAYANTSDARYNYSSPSIGSISSPVTGTQTISASSTRTEVIYTYYLYHSEVGHNVHHDAVTHTEAKATGPNQYISGYATFDYNSGSKNRYFSYKFSFNPGNYGGSFAEITSIGGNATSSQALGGNQWKLLCKKTQSGTRTSDSFYVNCYIQAYYYATVTDQAAYDEYVVDQSAYTENLGNHNYDWGSSHSYTSRTRVN